MERAEKTFSDYKSIAYSYGATEILARATSATRDAQNRDEFIDRIKKATGIEIECISGDNEGIFTFEGALEGVEGNIVLVDIGGGSTEVVYGNSKDGIEFIKSFDIGAVRLKEKFFVGKNGEEDYTSNRGRALLWIEEIFEEIEFLASKDFTLVAVAGTATTQASVALELVEYDSEKVHGYILTREQLFKNIELFKSMDLEERKNIKGLEPKRAEVIVSGSEILLYLMDKLNKKEIFVSENDILEGIMMS
jgi:exopolyphosphatase/guanosine-5'-triphosphate,3'-diphosphate pyrophosphatase